MKKVFSILMVAFALTAMVACGDKTEGTGNGGGNNNGGDTPDPGTEQTDALAETEWSYFEGDELMLDPYRYVDVIFGKHHSIVYGDNNHLSEPAVRVSAYGTYTYREFAAPEGFALDETAYDLVIREAGEIVRQQVPGVGVPAAASCGGGVFRFASASR